MLSTLKKANFSQLYKPSMSVKTINTSRRPLPSQHQMLPLACAVQVHHSRATCRSGHCCYPPPPDGDHSKLARHLAHELLLRLGYMFPVWSTHRQRSNGLGNLRHNRAGASLPKNLCHASAAGDSKNLTIDETPLLACEQDINRRNFHRLTWSAVLTVRAELHHRLGRLAT